MLHSRLLPTFSRKDLLANNQHPRLLLRHSLTALQ